MEDETLTPDDFGTYWREFPAWALVLYAKTPRGERSLRRGHRGAWPSSPPEWIEEMERLRRAAFAMDIASCPDYDAAGYAEAMGITEEDYAAVTRIREARERHGG